MPVVTLALFLAACLAQEEPVTLQWKVPKDGGLAFRTAFANADPGKDDTFEFDLSKFVESGTLPEDAKKFAFKLPSEFSATTVLQHLAPDRLGVKFVFGDMKLPAAEDEIQERMNELMKKLQQGVQLRGEITTSGRLESWWLESRQSTLIALYLELPGRPVRVGDSWPLNVKFITMGHGFRPSNATRVNRVRLASLARQDADTVATLEYVVAESVEGEFDYPGKPEPVPTTMRMSFIGQGEFLVGAGRWHRMTGRLSSKSTGVSESRSEQTLAMEPLDKVPPELLKLK